MSTALSIDFDNSYGRLPREFYARLTPTPVSAPRLLALNEGLCEVLGLSVDELRTEDGLDFLAGNIMPEDADPLAMVYAGHQFGGWVPRLGDGRAMLAGEVIGTDGVRYDLHFKGSGPTPYSRNGDGRSALGPVIREYIVSEAMAALGVPTTRALSAVASGDRVQRETGLPGGVFCRVAKSHIRVGTFQYFYSQGNEENLKALADYVVERLYPDLAELDGPERYAALLTAIATKQAELVAHWMSFGFIHGVMNTDNMSVAGETIDFGPCAFMDVYHRGKVFSSIDRNGRYAFANQPHMAHWNIAQLAQALLPLMSLENESKGMELAQAGVDHFAPAFNKAYFSRFAAKFGLGHVDGEVEAFVTDSLEILEKQKVDFTLFFRHLRKANEQPVQTENSFDQLFNSSSELKHWIENWQHMLQSDGGTKHAQTALMEKANPIFLPRNHRVEEAVQASYADDMSVFKNLIQPLARPYDDQPEFEHYEQAPKAEEVVRQTFCGT